MMQNALPSVTSQFVFDAELFRVTESLISYATGEKVVHNDVLVTPSVLIFPVTEQYDIYVVSEYRYLLKQTVLSAVSGSIEYNQKPLFVAKKELQEEAGLKASQWEELTKIELSTSIVREQVYLFLAKDLEQVVPRPEAHEAISLVKLSLHEAMSKVFTGEINHGPTMLGILMLAELKKGK